MFHNIIHLSDIHIRVGGHDKSRYHEYISTFNNLFASLHEQVSIQEKSSLIVITGDIFHHKNKLEPCGLELAIFLLTGLSKLAPVYLIRGNHDYRQDIPGERDMISALMSYQIPNVTYLDKTGIYDVDNISFGLVAIQDTLLYGSTSGVSKQLPDFPIPILESNYKVALFHGSITHSTLQNGMSMSESMHGYPIDWFKKYDVILLGDIHLQQIKRAEVMECKSDSLSHTLEQGAYKYTSSCPWGYPGSLIQQDFGETLLGHGYVLWNLKNKTIHTYHVANPYGFIKLQYKDSVDKIQIQFRDTYVPIDDVIYANWFPTYLRIYVSGNNLTKDVISEISQKIRKDNKTILCLKYSSDENKSSSQIILEEEQKDVIKINSIDVLIEYLENVLKRDKKDIPSIWKAWLKHPEKLVISTEHLPEKISKKISEKSEKIHKSALKYLDDFDKFTSQHSISGVLQLNRIEWNWILNYKDKNILDFDKNQKHISILNAKNGTGKSNFLEIICIALFGEGFPSRENNNYSAGLICDKKPSGTMANTTILFTINDTRYKLHRVMRTNTNVRSINYEKIILYQYHGDTEAILHQQKVAVHGWIHSHIGTLDNYLMSAMLSQNADRDFFSSDKSKQKTLLDSILSLTHINSMEALLKDSTKYYKNVSELIESYCDGASEKAIDPLLVTELEIAKKEFQTVSTLRSDLQTKWNSISEHTLLTTSFPDIQRKHTELLDYVNKLPQNDMQEVTHKLNEIEKHILVYTNYLSDFHSFSDLEPDSDSESEVIIQNIRKMQKYILNLRKCLEEHPLFKERNIYDDVKTIKSKINIHYKNNDSPLELFQTIRDFETWNKIKLSEFADYSFDAKYISDMEKKLDGIVLIITEYPSKITNLSKQLDKLQKQLLKKRKEKDELSDKRPNRPTKSESWMENAKKRFETEGQLSDLVLREESCKKKLSSLPMLCMNIVNLDKEIKEIESYFHECADVPFNPTCYACKKQTWRTKYEAYQNKLPTLQSTHFGLMNELNSLLGESDVRDGFDIHSYPSYLKRVEKDLISIGELIALHHLYDTELSLRKEYESWSELHEVAKKQYSEMELSCEAHKKSLKDLEIILQRNQLEKQQIESTIKIVATKKVDYQKYLEEVEIRKSNLIICAHRLDYQWYSKLFEYRNYVSGYIYYVKIHLENLHTEKETWTETFQQVMEREKCISECNALYKIIQVYPSWTQWKQESEKEKEWVLCIRELETRISGGIIVSGSDGLGEILGNVKQNMEIVSYLSDAFGGYREWLYKTHIAPMIQTRVNHVLATICDDRPLELEGEWLDKIDTLSWFIRDGTSRPIIEKASGFQRFIVGIAMRVAFYQIGFSQIQYGQLFIDEGFTSCDTDNLEKVPDFLRGLMRVYSSICLVTHLEDLKVCADQHIYIIRDESGLSQIRYGDNLEEAVGQVEEFQPAVKKHAGGRPVKNKVVVTKV